MSSSDFSAFALFTAGLAVFAPAVAALTPTPPGGSNPTAGDLNLANGATSVTAGQTTKLTWLTKTDICGDTVSLVLLYGPSSALMNPQDYIVQGIDNNGSYDWTPASNLKASDDVNQYGVEIVCVKTQAYQYTRRFALVNKNVASSSASASPSAYSSASASSSSASAASSSSSASVSSSAKASSSASAASSSATDSPKYPTGNSTSSGAATGGVTTTGIVTSTKTSSGSGSKTTGDSSSTTGSATSSQTSSAPSGSSNGAEHMKAGLGGLLIAAAVAAFAL